VTTPRQPFGVLYFTDDNPHFHRMLRMSLASLRKFHPDWPVHIVTVPSVPVPAWKHLYRALSFWKWSARRRRLGQNIRIIARKTQALQESPFDLTLYLDADTILLRPLDAWREAASRHNILITGLPWKHFTREHPWQPATWPYVMAGIFFYDRTFRTVFDRYMRQYGDIVPQLPLTDLNLLSMICQEEAAALSICYDQHLQLDHCNLTQLLGTDSWPRLGPCLDIRCPQLADFGLFHYNDFKPQYLAQIASVWGYTGEEPSPAP